MKQENDCPGSDQSCMKQTTDAVPSTISYTRYEEEEGTINLFWDRSL